MIKGKARIAEYITAPSDLDNELRQRLIVYKLKKKLKQTAKKLHFVPFPKIDYKMRRIRVEVGFIDDDFVYSRWSAIAKIDGYFQPPFIHRDYNRNKNRKATCIR